MIATLFNLLIWIIVLGLIAWLVFYVLQTMPMPEPFRAIARIVATVILVLLLIMLLLSLVGSVNLQLPKFG